MSTTNQTHDAGAPTGRYQLDPEIATALAPLAAAPVDAPVIARGDWRGLRENANANLAFLASLGALIADGVQMQSFSIAADDRAEVIARSYTRGDERPGSAVVYAHGGGMIAGNLDVYEDRDHGRQRRRGRRRLRGNHRARSRDRTHAPDPDLSDAR
jgi:hypothetical protein